MSPTYPVYMAIHHGSIDFLSYSARARKHQSGLVEKGDGIIRTLIGRRLIRYKHTQVRLIFVLQHLSKRLLHGDHQCTKSGSDFIEYGIKFFVAQWLVNDQQRIVRHQTETINPPFPIAIMSRQHNHRTPIIQKIRHHFRIDKMHTLFHFCGGDGPHF